MRNIHTRKAPEPWELLHKKLSMLDEITHWGEPVLITKYEKELYRDIKNGKRFFYLHEYENRSNRDALHNARCELLLQGQIIVLLGKDVQAFGHKGETFDKRYENKLVNISYQYWKHAYLKQFNTHVDKVNNDKKWIPLWVDTYNNYLSDYLIKVWDHIAKS